MASVQGQKKGFLHKLFGTTPNDGDIQPREGLAFSVAGFGQNMICTIVGSYLTVYMTDGIGIPALAVAFLMLFARIYDAFNDPIMGSIVDKTHTKWGKCRPFLKWMAIPIGIMTILCFLPVWGFDSSKMNVGAFVAVTIIYIIWGMVYTVVDVPYWALTTCMTTDTYKRGNMLTIARLICMAGAGIVTIILPQITGSLTGPLSEAGKYAEAGQKLQWIYFIASIIICVIAVPLFFVGFKGTVERNKQLEEKPRPLKENLKLLVKNKPLMLIVLSGVLGAARTGFTYTGGFYFAKYVLGNTNIMGFTSDGIYTLFTFSVIPGGLIASVLVPFFTKKVGKRNTYIYSHLVGGAAMLVAYFVGIGISKGDYTNPISIWIMMISFVIAGIPTGFGNIISYAMIGDTVEWLELKTGERAEGICYSMQTFISKIGMAVGAFFGVLSYHLAGIEANNVVDVTPEGKDIMWLMLVLIGAVSFIASAIPLFFYKFNEKQQQEAVKIIAERKAAAQNLDSSEATENTIDVETNIETSESTESKVDETDE